MHCNVLILRTLKYFLRRARRTMWTETPSLSPGEDTGILTTQGDFYCAINTKTKGSKVIFIAQMGTFPPKRPMCNCGKFLNDMAH